MKLLVIVICLLCERFLIHASASKRYEWMSAYVSLVSRSLARVPFFATEWGQLILTLAPIGIITYFIYCVLCHILFGFVGFIFSLIIFYLCIGPGNPFYPAYQGETLGSDAEINLYLVNINTQLIALIFWYCIMGPVGAILYRLVTICSTCEAMKGAASQLMQWLEWVPARLTAILYLLVGHFQAGASAFTKRLFSSADDNHTLLSECGWLALGAKEGREVQFSEAVSLVENAIILLLVLLALLTLSYRF